MRNGIFSPLFTKYVLFLRNKSSNYIIFENVHTGRPVCNVWLKACLSCTIQHINLPNFILPISQSSSIARSTILRNGVFHLYLANMFFSSETKVVIMIFLYENVHTGRPVCNVWLKACLSCTVQHINLPNFSFKNLKFKDFKQRVSLWLQTGKENSKSLLIFRLLKLTFVADDDSLPGPFYLYLQCRSMGRCPGGLGAPPPQ